jgi:prophage regulatory protein
VAQNTLLRLPIVMRKCGLSRSAVYARIAQGAFPQPVKLGERAVGWVESEIDQWIEDRIERSRNGDRKPEPAGQGETDA